MYSYCFSLITNVTDSDMTRDGGGATEVLVIYSYLLIVLISEYQQCYRHFLQLLQNVNMCTKCTNVC